MFDSHLELQYTILLQLFYIKRFSKNILRTNDQLKEE